MWLTAQTAPKRLRVRRLTPPRSLALLLCVVVVVGLAWALIVPPWQAPDELAHYAYAQGLAESFTLPGGAGPQDSSDQTAGDISVGASRGAFYPISAPPDWSRADYQAYLASVRSHPPSRTDGGGNNPASPNPPLYYLFASVGYLIDHGGTTFGRLYAMRIWGVLLLVLTTVGGWLLAGEVLGRRRLAQLACAAVVGLMPMAAFMSTSVNPDAMLMTLWTMALWLGARVIRRSAPAGDTVALAAVTAAAILTKATSYALVVPVLFAVGAGWWRRGAGSRREALKPLAPAAAVLAAPVIGWVLLTRALGRAAVNSVGSTAAHPVNIRQFISYVWQYYLPRLPFLTSFRTTGGLPLYQVWIKQGFGTFGWLDIYLPGWMYPAAAIGTAATGVAAVGILLTSLRRRHLALLAFLALTLLALLALLHASEYLMIIDGSGAFLQGRYLLPVVGLLGLTVGLIVWRIPARARPAACAVVVIGLLATQVVSLSSVVQGYYL